jgi:hypothetical protein
MWVKTFVFFLTSAPERPERCFLYACYGNTKAFKESGHYLFNTSLSTF